MSLRRRVDGKLDALRGLWWCCDASDGDLRWLGRQAELVAFRCGEIIAATASPSRWLYLEAATGSQLCSGAEGVVAAADGDVLIIPCGAEEELRRRFTALFTAEADVLERPSPTPVPDESLGGDEASNRESCRRTAAVAERR